MKNIFEYNYCDIVIRTISCKKKHLRLVSIIIHRNLNQIILLFNIYAEMYVENGMGIVPKIEISFYSCQN